MVTHYLNERPVSKSVTESHFARLARAMHSDDGMTPALWITLIGLGLGLEPETDVACEYVATYAYDRAEACQGDDCPDAADGAFEDTMALCLAAVDGSTPARAHFLALAGEAGQ